MAEEIQDIRRAGLCVSCAFARRIPHPRGGPAYWRCARSESDPAFPRFPALPVIKCRGYATSQDGNPEA